MSWLNNSNNASYVARGAIRGFTERGIALPNNVTAAVAVLDRIDAEKPLDPDPKAVRNAIVDGAGAAEIDRLLLADLAAGRLRSEYAQARIIAARRVLDSILDERQALHAALKIQADDAIAHIGRVAALEGQSLEQLVRDGRHADAQDLAEVDVVGAELDELYGLRDSCLIRGGLLTVQADHIDCSRYRDVRVAARHGDPNRGLAANMVYVVRQGAELWFPDAEQALEAASAVYSEWHREAARKAAKQRDGGRLLD